MLQLITGGNSFNYLHKLYRVGNNYVSINFINKNNIIVPLKNYRGWDNLNKIKTCNVTKGSKKDNGNKYLYNFFKNSIVFIWTRIVFRGKGFRVRNFKKDLKLTFNFGHSHWDKLKFYKWWWFFKRRRQSYVVVSIYIDTVLFFERNLSAVRVVNRYTNRGLRIKRQPIIRRFGKISQVVSLLH